MAQIVATLTSYSDQPRTGARITPQRQVDASAGGVATQPEEPATNCIPLRRGPTPAAQTKARSHGGQSYFANKR